MDKDGCSVGVREGRVVGTAGIVPDGGVKGLGDKRGIKHGVCHPVRGFFSHVCCEKKIENKWGQQDSSGLHPADALLLARHQSSQSDTIGSGFPPETQPLKQVGEIGLTNT